MIAALDLQFECPCGAVVVVQALVGPLLRRDGHGWPRGPRELGEDGLCVREKYEGV